MRKAILLIAFITFLGNELVYAEGKTLSLAASCYVPERLELSQVTIDAYSLKEKTETILQNTSSETQFVQKEEFKESDSDTGSTLIYTITAR